MKQKASTKALSWLFSLAMLVGLFPALSAPALAADGDTSYTLTIPSTLTVANSGWNATDGISATGTLASGKKLTVTASSGDEFALVNQSDSTQKVGYKLATASTDTEATTSWEFTELSSTATKKDMGIIVEDYSTKPAGTYTDTVTFTAKVEDSFVSVLAPALENGGKIKFEYNWNGLDSNTYFEFTNNNGTYTLSSLTGQGADTEHGEHYFDTTNLRVKADNPNVLILDVVNGEKDEDETEITRNESFCSTIEFDATDNTFKFTKRGVTPTNRKCKLISVSVNGTDVTNQLTDISPDKS